MVIQWNKINNKTTFLHADVGMAFTTHRFHPKFSIACSYFVVDNNIIWKVMVYR